MMMPSRSTLFALAAVLLAAAVAFTQTACDSGGSDIGDGRSDAPLTLSGVRYQSPDSTGVVPSQIGPGDLVALEGENMDAVGDVYFNGVEVSFNSALASEEYLVVSVPADLPFGAMDPNAETFGTIRVTNAGSEATIEFPVLPPAPTLQGVDNEYATPGTQVTLTGQSLYLAESLTLPDSTTIPGEDIEASDDGTSATFTLPASASTAEGPVTYTTASGTDVSDPAFYFHDTRGLILNWDTALNWQYWAALSPDNGAPYDEMAALFSEGAQGEFVILMGEGEIPGGSNAWYNNYRSANLNPSEIVPDSSLGEAPSNFAIKFEMNIAQDWGAGTIQVLLPENDYAAMYRPWTVNSDGTTNAVSWDGWRTITLPLSTFMAESGEGDAATSLEALLGEDGVADAGSDGSPWGLRLLNVDQDDVQNAEDGAAGSEVIPAGQAFAIDNLRAVRIAGMAAEAPAE